MNKIEFSFEKFLFQKVEKEVKYLYISHLLYLEELRKNNIISEEEYSDKRKQCLDLGNNAIRNIESEISSVFSNISLS
jgi:hypothetical protein